LLIGAAGVVVAFGAAIRGCVALFGGHEGTHNAIFVTVRGDFGDGW